MRFRGKEIVRTGILFAAGILAFAVLPTSCRVEQSPSISKGLQTPLAGSPDLATKPVWEQEWDNTLITARREDKVVLYGSIRPTFRDDISQAFKNKFGITVEVVSGGGGEIVQRLKTESKGGLNLADVYVGGNTTQVLLLKPSGLMGNLEKEMILPEVLDAKAWWGNGLRWADKEHRILAFTAYPDIPLGINTEFVKIDEIKCYLNFKSGHFKVEKWTV